MDRAAALSEYLTWQRVGRDGVPATITVRRGDEILHSVAAAAGCVSFSFATEKNTETQPRPDIDNYAFGFGPPEAGQVALLLTARYLSHYTLHDAAERIVDIGAEGLTLEMQHPDEEDGGEFSAEFVYAAIVSTYSDGDGDVQLYLAGASPAVVLAETCELLKAAGKIIYGGRGLDPGPGLLSMLGLG